MHISARTKHFQTTCLHCREMGAARQEGHLGPGLGQRRSERATNSAGTDHRDPHRVPSAFALRKGWHSSIAFSKLKVSQLIGAARCSPIACGKGRLLYTRANLLFGSRRSKWCKRWRCQTFVSEKYFTVGRAELPNDFR